MKKLLVGFMVVTSTVALADRDINFGQRRELQNKGNQLVGNALQLEAAVANMPHAQPVMRNSRQLVRETQNFVQMVQSNSNVRDIKEQFRRYVAEEFRELKQSYQQTFGMNAPFQIRRKFDDVQSSFQNLRNTVQNLQDFVQPPHPPVQDACRGFSTFQNIQCCIVDRPNQCAMHIFEVKAVGPNCVATASTFNTQAVQVNPHSPTLNFSAMNPTHGNQNVTVTLDRALHGNINYYNYAGRFWGRCQF